jgi:sigma-E factor negative regulatory protein RseB
MSVSPASRNRVIKRRRRVSAACLLALSLAQPAIASDEAARWLEKVAEAAKTVNYEGVFVYQRDGALEAMRIIHRADDGGETERLYSLTGEPREIIRDDEKVTSIVRDNGSVVMDRRQVSNPLTQLVPRDVESLTRHYTLELAGDARIADRAAKQLTIVPRDKFRYGYQLWIDEETGLLLRADVFSAPDKRIEQLMFTQLQPRSSIPASALEPRLVGRSLTELQQSPAGAPVEQDGNWKIGSLPPGFELVLQEPKRIPGSEGPVTHLLFSDGLAHVSVYIEKTPVDDVFTGHSEMGALNAYGRVVNDTQITAVGEVPPVTVQRIGESIEPAG